eukprot:360973-Chlamydomonas_euryale.AAC.2
MLPQLDDRPSSSCCTSSRDCQQTAAVVVVVSGVEVVAEVVVVHMQYFPDPGSRGPGPGHMQYCWGPGPGHMQCQDGDGSLVSCACKAGRLWRVWLLGTCQANNTLLCIDVLRGQMMHRKKRGEVQRGTRRGEQAGTEGDRAVQRGIVRYRGGRGGTEGNRQVQMGTWWYRGKQAGIEGDRAVQRGTVRYRGKQGKSQAQGSGLVAVAVEGRAMHSRCMHAPGRTCCISLSTKLSQQTS